MPSRDTSQGHDGGGDTYAKDGICQKRSQQYCVGNDVVVVC